MKQTRKIVISDKVFNAEDLRRIAKIFEKNKMLARKSDHHASTQYEVAFSNHTSLETDSPEPFDDESLAGTGRPESMQMSFWNYPLDRHIRISLNHGDSSYDNQAVVSSNESTWVGENFLALQEAIDKVQPQTVWFRKHKTLLLNLIALGIGCIGFLIIDFAVDHFLYGCFRPSSNCFHRIPRGVKSCHQSLCASWYGSGAGQVGSSGVHFRFGTGSSVCGRVSNSISV